MARDSLARAEIKIFGERNTGTNALKRLIEKNSVSRVLPSIAKELDPRVPLVSRLVRRLPFAALLREAYVDRVFSGKPPRYAWKHAATAFEGVEDFAECGVIFTTRDPASWLLALHRRPYHAFARVPADFAAFLKTSWKPVKRDKLKEEAVTPPQMWNIKMRSYIAFAHQLKREGVPFVWLRFEDFVANQGATFDRIRGLLFDPADCARPVEESTKDKRKDYLFYREYYGCALWMSDIDAVSRSIIDRDIDWEVAELFGYQPLAAAAMVIDTGLPRAWGWDRATLKRTH